MKTLDELYQQMLKRAADGKPIGVEGEPRLIDCLAHPDDHPLVWRVKPASALLMNRTAVKKRAIGALLNAVLKALKSMTASASAARPVSMPASSTT